MASAARDGDAMRVLVTRAQSSEAGIELELCDGSSTWHRTAPLTELTPPKQMRASEFAERMLAGVRAAAVRAEEGGDVRGDDVLTVQIVAGGDLELRWTATRLLGQGTLGVRQRLAQTLRLQPELVAGTALRRALDELAGEVRRLEADHAASDARLKRLRTEHDELDEFEAHLCEVQEWPRIPPGPRAARAPAISPAARAPPAHFPPSHADYKLFPPPSSSHPPAEDRHARAGGPHAPSPQQEEGAGCRA